MKQISSDVNINTAFSKTSNTSLFNTNNNKLNKNTLSINQNSESDQKNTISCNRASFNNYKPNIIEENKEEKKINKFLSESPLKEKVFVRIDSARESSRKVEEKEVNRRTSIYDKIEDSSEYGTKEIILLNNILNNNQVSDEDLKSFLFR